MLDIVAGVWRNRSDRYSEERREATDAGYLKVEDAVQAADQFTALIKTFLFWPQLIGDTPIPGEPERRAADTGNNISHYDNTEGAYRCVDGKRLPV